MAKIIEEKVTIVMSRIATNDTIELPSILIGDDLVILQQAVEGLINNDSDIVEVFAERVR
jgi:hypothetical protein